MVLETALIKTKTARGFFVVENFEMKNNKRNVVIGIAALAAIIIVFAGIYLFFGADPVKGTKSITIDVVDDRQQKTTYRLETDAEYLQQAMEEAEGLTFSGTEGVYGMMVDTVNGIRADYNTNGAYWGFYVNGEYCNYGIGEQPVQDGDVFSIEYTPAVQ